MDADLTDGMFVSLFVCVYDSRKQTLEFQNAGHTAPLLYSPESDTFQEILSNAPALGIIDEISAGPCPSIAVRKGDFLVCYTDGVTEMHSRDGTLYGEARIKQAVRSAVRKGADPEGVVAAIRADLREHGDDLPARDDVTLVACRF